MTRAQYTQLFKKYLNGDASAAEIESIFAYKDEFDIQDIELEKTSKEYLDIERRLIKKLNSQIYIKHNLNWAYKIAATILLLLAIGFFTVRYQNGNKKVAINSNAEKPLIIPGSNKALLTMSSGKTVVLNDIGDGNVTNEGDVRLKKERKGVIKFDVNKIASLKNDASLPEMLTVSTPKGGQYQLILSDGTAVWLNADSYLKFPSTFTGSERLVELNGEGYFEVAKNKKMPFKVRFNKQEVTVLGTHFNIRSYQDDPESQTTLLEGSVNITHGQFSKVIVPGQQAVCDALDANIKVLPAKIEDVVAWKNGYFSFHKADIKSIMRQAARWYNIDVTYQANLEDKIYGGRVSRFDNITELLKNLELTGTIHFKVEGRRVTVME